MSTLDSATARYFRYLQISQFAVGKHQTTGVNLITFEYGRVNNQLVDFYFLLFFFLISVSGRVEFYLMPGIKGELMEMRLPEKWRFLLSQG